MDDGENQQNNVVIASYFYVAVVAAVERKASQFSRTRVKSVWRNWWCARQRNMYRKLSFCLAWCSTMLKNTEPLHLDSNNRDDHDKIIWACYTHVSLDHTSHFLPVHQVSLPTPNQTLPSPVYQVDLHVSLTKMNSNVHPHSKAYSPPQLPHLRNTAHFISRRSMSSQLYIFNMIATVFVSFITTLPSNKKGIYEMFRLDNRTPKALYTSFHRASRADA